ncbi:MAG TPA: SDR family NAD(P)-dependent oxidoreductase [Acidobacteriaceae bacterium]
MIDLNVTALMRLTYTALPGFLKRGGGAIINIASVVGIVPEFLNGVYGGTKAFVLAFSRSLHKEICGEEYPSSSSSSRFNGYRFLGQRWDSASATSAGNGYER